MWPITPRNALETDFGVFQDGNLLKTKGWDGAEGGI